MRIGGEGEAVYSAEQVLTALYQAAFGRDPDPSGLNHYCNLLKERPTALLAIAAELFESDEHRSCLNHLPAIVDHSQFREFTLLIRQYVAASQRHGIVVDVGARGRDRSNSYDLLANFGWRGLLVEANPALQENIAREFAATDFTLVNCAIGIQEGLLPFYLGVNNDVSSLIQDNAAAWGDLSGELQVEVKRLAPLLEQHSIPSDFDLLSLDIEGMDALVLNDLIDNSHFRPLRVIIEASYDYKTKTLGEAGCSELVQSHYVITAQTQANLILELRT